MEFDGVLVTKFKGISTQVKWGVEMKEPKASLGRGGVGEIAECTLAEYLSDTSLATHQVELGTQFSTAANVAMSWSM